MVSAIHREKRGHWVCVTCLTAERKYITKATRGRGAYFGSQFEGIVHHTLGKAWGSWSHCTHSQGTERDRCVLVLLTQDPNLWKVPPSLGVFSPLLNLSRSIHTGTIRVCLLGDSRIYQVGNEDLLSCRMMELVIYLTETALEIRIMNTHHGQDIHDWDRRAGNAWSFPKASLSAEDEWSWGQDPEHNYQRDYSVKDVNSQVHQANTRPWVGRNIWINGPYILNP